MLCTCCMENHEVKRVIIRENNIFKNTDVEYDAEYFYCENADEYFADESMATANDISMKNAYRKRCGLLTTSEIVAIREKYGVSQSDLCQILGWGVKTITRYESHQVQDKAHDTILRKISTDPEWFLKLLDSAKDSILKASFDKYYATGLKLFEADHDLYLQSAIIAQYSRYFDNEECCGGKRLNLNIVSEMIRYYANSQLVTSLYKVKLMKMLWYADALSYKCRGYSMSGMVYKALPMGAVPVAYDSIIDLSSVHYEEVEIGEGTACLFMSTNNNDYSYLTSEDKRILDVVVKHFGGATKAEIVMAMHKEVAYRETAPFDVIQYKYAKELSFDK